MVAPSANEVTQLLINWRNGDREALDRLIPLVESELRRIARQHMRRERVGHTLQTTALVNEAYLRLIHQKNVAWQNRAHFFAIAAQLMRRILVDHAKSNLRQKRGGGAYKVSLEEADLLAAGRAAELIQLDEALARLSALDPRKSQVVEMRYFGGLSLEEMAEVLGISPNTVMRDWNTARAWLRREMGAEGADEA